MTKKNKVIFRLLGVFVVLLLVSICLLGSTFARYTSSGSGSASTDIADWDLSNTQATTSITYDNLSPNMAAYDTTSATNSASMAVTAPTDASGVSGYAYGNRYHTTGLTTVGTIYNGGDVNAYVKIDTAKTVKTVNLTYTNSGYVEDSDSIYVDVNGNNTYDSGSDTDTGFTTTNIEDRFSIVFVYSIDSGNLTSTDDGYLVSVGRTLTISAYVIWTSYDAAPGTSGTDEGEAADTLDTIIGECGGSVTFSFTWKAVQASELPAVA